MRALQAMLVTSSQVIVRVAKVQNKIVAVAAREGFPIGFESTVEREKLRRNLSIRVVAKMFSFFAKASNSLTMRVDSRRP